MIKKSNFAVAANKDLFENPCQRLPICLCLDISGSMKLVGKIDQLNNGVKMFYHSIQNDEITTNSSEISIVTFGEFPAKARCIRDFSRVDIQHQPPVLIAEGLTPLGEGVNLALDLLENRKKSYKKAGISYFRPWLIIMSDGHPEGHSTAELTRAQNRVIEMTSSKKIVSLPISIGNCDNPELAIFGNGTLLHLKEDCFLDFFNWLHRSVSESSSGTPGDEMDFKKLLENQKPGQVTLRMRIDTIHL